MHRSPAVASFVASARCCVPCVSLSAQKRPMLPFNSISHNTPSRRHFHFHAALIIVDPVGPVSLVKFHFTPACLRSIVAASRPLCPSVPQTHPNGAVSPDARVVQTASFVSCSVSIVLRLLTSAESGRSVPTLPGVPLAGISASRRLCCVDWPDDIPRRRMRFPGQVAHPPTPCVFVPATFLFKCVFCFVLGRVGFPCVVFCSQNEGGRAVS